MEGRNGENRYYDHHRHSVLFSCHSNEIAAILAVLTTKRPDRALRRGKMKDMIVGLAQVLFALACGTLFALALGIVP